ncbi:MAG: TIGR03915 family putative DNA repair protein [Oscillospiraceae bacterium]|nr:TIGR03915 family putative DNA repair protein [Oscillospiraceae bacterium]
MIRLYDGSWEGLLSAIFQVFRHRGFEDEILSALTFPGHSLYPVYEAATDPEQARRVTRGMARLSPALPKSAYRAFLSEQPGMEAALLGTLRLGFAREQNPLPLLGEAPVKKLVTLSRRVSMERERFLGLTRLRHVGEDLYAADIEPEYRILPLLGTHFHARFGDQRLIIRDIRRRLALVSTPQAWWIAELPAHEDLPPLPRDLEMSSLWRAYFAAIANPARENLRLQQGFVPLRYRGNVTEFISF